MSDHSRSIDLRIHSIRQDYLENMMRIGGVKSRDNTSDILTKSLQPDLHIRHTQPLFPNRATLASEGSSGVNNELIQAMTYCHHGAPLTHKQSSHMRPLTPRVTRDFHAAIPSPDTRQNQDSQHARDSAKSWNWEPRHGTRRQDTGCLARDRTIGKFPIRRTGKFLATNRREHTQVRPLERFSPGRMTSAPLPRVNKTPQYTPHTYVCDQQAHTTPTTHHTQPVHPHTFHETTSLPHPHAWNPCSLPTSTKKRRKNRRSRNKKPQQKKTNNQKRYKSF